MVLDNSKVIAGIVSYNPEIDRLEQNIKAICEQVCEVVLIDNASKNIEEVASLCQKYGVTVICNEENKGIATALNQMMGYSYVNSYGWVVTLDQDSVCPSNLISESYTLLQNDNIGQIVPLIMESNAGEFCYLGTAKNEERFQEVEKSITSAAITNVTVWEKVGKFDDDFFIDYVDYDYAMKVRLNGYKIVRMNNVVLDHHIGNAVKKKIIFKDVMVLNHSEFRKYYIARNIVIFIRKYKFKINILAELLRLAKLFIFVIMFEEKKHAKICAICKGVSKGMRAKI